MCGYAVRLFGAEAFSDIDRDNAYEVIDRMKALGELDDTPASKTFAVVLLTQAFWGQAVLRHPDGKEIGPANLEQAYRSGMAYPEGWIRVNKRPAYVD